MFHNFCDAPHLTQHSVDVVVVVIILIFSDVLICFLVTSLSASTCFSCCECFAACIYVSQCFSQSHSFCIVSFFCFREGGLISFIAMAEPRFTLYLVVEQRFRAAFERDGVIPMSIVNPGGYYIGLRECPIEAFIRAKRLYVQGTMSRESHILLKIHFSPAAVLHYISKSAGPDYAFASVLHKRTYSGDKDVDWKVWYFLEDLPLHGDDPLSLSVLTSEWYDLPETYFDLFC